MGEEGEEGRGVPSSKREEERGAAHASREADAVVSETKGNMSDANTSAHIAEQIQDRSRREGPDRQIANIALLIQRGNIL